MRTLRASIGVSLSRILTPGTSSPWPALLVLAVGLVAACSDSKGVPPGTLVDAAIYDGSPPKEGGTGDISVTPDIGVTPDTFFNVEGPVITILTPTPDQVTIGALLTIEAMIVDPDGIDASTVKVLIEKGLPGPVEAEMRLTTKTDVYAATIEVTAGSGKMRARVAASDIQGAPNEKVVDFARDPGPDVQVIAPADVQRLKGAMTVQISVNEAVVPVGGMSKKAAITSFNARIGTVQLPLNNQAQPSLYVGTIDFADPQLFGDDPLIGEQVMTVTAEDEFGAKTIVERNFVVDVVGPSIGALSHSAGQLIGAVINLEATVTDPAGVEDVSVRVVIGNDLDNKSVPLTRVSPTSSVFKGQFDTRNLLSIFFYPVMSFRAADLLGNEAHVDFEVALDNGTPRIELDPKTVAVSVTIDDNGLLHCSHPIDPVGSFALSDGSETGQLATILSYASDQGNNSFANGIGPGAAIPVAGLNEDSARLFIMSNTSQALIIDTDGDGYCDAINPEVVPTGSTPTPDEAVALDLQVRPPAGTEDFTPFGWDPLGTAVAIPPGATAETPGQTTFYNCLDGEEEDPPAPICSGFSDLTVFLPDWYLGAKSAALFGIPPVGSCVGLPFDFIANNIPNSQWVCMAAEIRDALGNVGVSPTVRVWTRYQAPPLGSDPASPGLGAAPHCTGTQLPDGTIDANAPCALRSFDGFTEGWPLQRYGPACVFPKSLNAGGVFSIDSKAGDLPGC